MERKIVNDKSSLFVKTESECHFLRVNPDSDEYLKVWVKEPTWLQVEQALSSVMNVDAKNQDMTLDLNGMYRYMAENFIERTEPSLSTIDLLRLNSYVGNQLKEILPNPFGDLLEGDEEKNGKSVGL
tara:strand:- start:543 stop:923 length:381 start_codon:yes stop_codon:yes gene_type:complete